jgi:hypothetical protein
MLSLLNVARPIAMKALQNPKILGSLLVGAVGSQQANEIQNQLKLGNISLDNIYDTLINFAASPAVSALRDTPSGQESSPDEAQIEAERKFNEELNKRVTLPSEVSIDQILSTPPTTTVPEPLITPDVPEEKTKVEDVGFTAADAVKLEDMIMTAKNPEDLFKDERFQEVLKMAKGDPNVDYRAQDKKDGDYIMEAPQGNTFWTTAGFPGDKMNPAKSVIIYVKPGDYLNLAKKKEDGYNEASFELYKNTNVGISIPKLLMNENEGGYFSVTGHEGRHRAKYFEGLDPDTPIPVQVQLTNKGSDEYVDYTKGYYTHGQSVLNAGKKLEELGFAQNENGGLTKFKIFGYQGDGKKIGEIFEKGDISDANEETIGTRQEEGQTTIEALKAQSEESKARDVDRGPQSDQGEYVLKTEEGFEIAPLEQSSDFFTRTMLGEIGTPKSRYEPILNLSELGQTFDIFEEKRSGNFENHIFTSIPTFKEAQVATADALIKSLPQNANVLDIGGTEGGFINTIAEVRPDVTGFIVDPNVVAEKIFNQQKMPNSYYIREAFTTDKSKFGNYAFDVKDEKKQPISTDFFDANLIEDNSLDAITEKMTFQFIDKGRNNKVKLISEKLKPTGIALFEEKFFTSYDDPVWKENEAKKNEFKLLYYDQKDLTKKQKETLEGMDRRQVTSEDFENILMKHFNNVAQYWDSGNFKGYVASDSADALNNFLSNLPDLNSEYSNVQTPSFVTKPIMKKRRGGPISIPKIDML